MSDSPECMPQEAPKSDEELLATLRYEIGRGLRAAADGRFSRRTVAEIAAEVLRDQLKA